MKKYINSPGFWIVLFLLIRLTGITNPPLEISHSWRQVTGLMVARNFLEVDANIFYPRVDDHQGTTGIIGMEFPALNYLHYLTASVFGYTHWYGRLINLLISSVGIFFFVRIVSRYFTQRVALVACLILLTSAWFSFSRKMMPDTFCISLMFIALYSGIRYLESGKIALLLGYIFLVSIAVLSKIPAGIYFGLLVPLVFLHRFSRRSLMLVAFTIPPLILTGLWYFVWNPFLSAEYGIWTNSGQPILVGLNELASNFGAVLKRFYFNAFFGFVFFAVFVAGLFLAFKNKHRGLLAITASIGLLFLVYMIRSGFYFHHHDYYIIPFVPVMALVAGYAIAQIKVKWAFVLVLLIGMVESIGNQQHDFFIKDSERYKLEIESMADAVSSSSDWIAINGNGNHQELYLAHRKGWNIFDDQLTDPHFIQEITEQGCRYVFVNRHRFQQPLDLPVVLETDDYLIYTTIKE